MEKVSVTDWWNTQWFSSLAGATVGVLSALIVGISRDYFSYYTKTNNINEIQYCLKNAHEIVKNKSETFKDPLFEELKMW